MGVFFKLLRPASLIAIATVLLVALVLWAGLELGLPRIAVFLAAAFIVVLALALAAFLKARSARTAEALERSLARQADAQIQGTRPGRKEEIEKLKTQLFEAIVALKTSRVGSAQKSRSGALYVLPWYMIIGPPAAGKSTLLRNSGLNFPYLDPTKETRVKGVGGTRNCDWWFADQAVILDTAGRYVQQPSEADDSEEWLAFLDLLRRHRSRKPINGLIVAISMQDLLTADEEGIEEHAKKIRSRIDEIIKHLGVIFPVYVLFTKCDLVRGFVEFFGNMTKAERAQIWGATLARDETRAPAEAFEREFDAVLARLEDVRTATLADETRPEARPDVFFFPIQLESARAKLARFVRVLFRENPYQELPVFRGFYLTSGTQEGRPIDRVINAMLRGFGLDERQGGMLVEPGQTKSYFIEDVFSKVMFPDRHMAGPSRGGERKKRALRVRVFAAGCVLLAAATLLLLGFSARNSRLLSDTRHKAEKVAALAQADPDALAFEDLERLDALRARLETLETQGRPLVKAVTLWTYQGEKASDQACAVFFLAERHMVLDPMAEFLERELFADSSARFMPAFRRYKTWRTLREPEQLDQAETPELAANLAEAWSRRFGAASAGDAGKLTKIFERLLAYSSRHPVLLAETGARMRRDDPARLHAEETLCGLWNADALFADLISEVGGRATPISASSLAGADGGVSGSAELPGAFTKAGWTGPAREYLDEIESIRHDWAMRDVFHGEPPSLRDAVQARYGGEYGAEWISFLHGLSVAPPSGVEGMDAFLSRAETEDSPILKLLRGVKENVSFDGADGPARSVDAAFEALRWFLAPSSPAKKKGETPEAPYQAYLQRVAALHQSFAEISSSPSGMQHPTVIQLASWVDANVARRGGDAAPEIARILKLPSFSASTSITKGVAQDLQDSWRAQVYAFYESNLAGRYPIAADASQEVALPDFVEFFKPDGILWSFYKASLSSLVSMDGQPLPGAPVSVSAGLRHFLSAANDIRRTLFAADLANASLRLNVSTSVPHRIPPDCKVTVRKAILKVGGEGITYAMGPENPSPLAWPGSNPDLGASLELEVSGSASSPKLSRAGAWGLFRLLDRAEVRAGASGNEVTASWTLPAGGCQVEQTYVMQTGSAAKVLRPGFLRVAPPPGL